MANNTTNNYPALDANEDTVEFDSDVDGSGVHIPTVQQKGTDLSIYRDIDADETGVNVKGSAGAVHGYYIYNAATSVRYVKFYDSATAPTVGTDTPVLTFPIPSESGANVEWGLGVAFANGIGIGVTTGVADNDTGAPSANDVQINLFYS